MAQSTTSRVSVYIETHWIIHCVLGQDTESDSASRSLLNLDDPGIAVWLPAFSLTEAMICLRDKAENAESLRSKMAAMRDEVNRLQREEAKNLAASLEEAIQRLRALLALQRKDLMPFLAEVHRSRIQIIPESPSVLLRADEYLTRKIGWGDAIVLATVVEHTLSQPAARAAFLSGNKNDFGPTKPAGQELQERGIKYFSRAQAMLGWARNLHLGSDLSS